MKNNCLFTPLPQPLSFSPRCNLFLVLNICIDYQCIHKHVQVYIVHETHGLCGTMLHTLLCILLFHLVYLGSSLFNRYPAGEYLFPIFFYLNSSAIIIPYRCHFTLKADISMGWVFRSGITKSRSISAFNFGRYCQIALTQSVPICILPANVHECFPLVKYLLSNTLIFVILAFPSFVLHLSYCEWGLTSFPMIKNRL